MKNQYRRGDCLKREGRLGQFADLRGGCLARKRAWTVCRFKRGGAWQERGVVFDVGLIPKCTLWLYLIAL